MSLGHTPLASLSQDLAYPLALPPHDIRASLIRQALS